MTVALAHQASSPIGRVALREAAREARLRSTDLAIIHGLVVDETLRSGGIGNELVDAAEAWARSTGATTIIVRSRVARQRAHRFYERIGYVEVKVSHTFSKPLV